MTSIESTMMDYSDCTAYSNAAEIITIIKSIQLVSLFEPAKIELFSNPSKLIRSLDRLHMDADMGIRAEF